MSNNKTSNDEFAKTHLTEEEQTRAKYRSRSGSASTKAQEIVKFTDREFIKEQFIQTNKNCSENVPILCFFLKLQLTTLFILKRTSFISLTGLHPALVQLSSEWTYKSLLFVGFRILERMKMLKGFEAFVHWGRNYSLYQQVETLEKDQQHEPRSNVVPENLK